MRFKAFMLDYVLIFAYLVVLVIINVFLFPSVQSFFSESLVVAQLTGFLMVTLPVSLYFIISDSVIVGQSFGKRMMGIKVVNVKDENLPILHSICRTTLKFLPWELSHYCLSPHFSWRSKSTVYLLCHWRYYLCAYVCIYFNLYIF
ncbi:RDD family protein [Psychrobacillus sp. NPDC096623]|uniref:RDD family protein n=1 Tax=Psychrobacillus sp. NPDC096623 TaxID=3364492 RepID=UPI00380F78DC